MSSLVGNTGIVSPLGKTGAKVPKGYRSGQLPQYTPEQMQLFSQLFGNVGPDSYLSKLAGGSQDAFNKLEAPALQQFAGLQGNIASRFSGAGSFGARRSSGFQNTMGQQASDFAQQLQANRQGLQRQAIYDLMGLSESLLGQRPYLTGFAAKQPKESSGWGGLIGAGAGTLTGLVPGFGASIGGPLGGAQIGYGIGSAF